MYNLLQLSLHCAPAVVLNVESLETLQQPGGGMFIVGDRSPQCVVRKWIVQPYSTVRGLVLIRSVQVVNTSEKQTQ